MPAGITRGGLTVKLAGQDISTYVSEPTIVIKDTLAQGAGTNSGGTGRAKKGSFLCSLGPAASALGSGQPIPPIYTNLFSPNQADVEVDASGFDPAGGVTVSRDATTAWHG